MATFFLIGTAFNFIVFLISLVFTKQWKASAVYFNLCLVMSTIPTFTTYIMWADKMSEFPHLYRVGTLAIYIFWGGLLLFSQKSFNKNYFHWTDGLFFLPAFVFLIDFSHFFLQSTEIKRTIVINDLAHGEINLFKQALFLPPKFHFYIRSITALFVLGYQCIFMINLLRKGNKVFLEENKQLILWNFIYALLVGISFIPNILLVFKGLTPSFTDIYVAIPTFLTLIVFPVSLLFTPKILYGSKGFWSEESPQLPTKTENALPKIYFTSEKAELMATTINAYMNESKAYLNPTFNLNQLAADTHFQARHISNLLNNFLDISFNDYLNQYRVKHFIERYQNDPEAKKITFEALANECGFNSRFTFINAFKKYTGKTPTKYFNTPFE